MKETDSNLFSTAALIVYLRSEDDISKIQKEVDTLFSEYVFYPELDWDQYGYRPPECHQVLGAWRHFNSRLFIFLLDNPFMMSCPPACQVLFHLAGETFLITQSQKKLNQLKTTFALSDKKAEANVETEKRLTKMGVSRQYKILFGVLTLFTISLNTIAFFLKNQALPEFESQFLTVCLQYLLITVHLLAVSSLLIVMLISIILFVKYGLFFIRKM